MPTGSGVSNFTVQVTDAGLQTATQPLSISIAPSGGGTISLIQSAAVQGTNVTSLSQAFLTNNAPNDLIVVLVRASTTTQTVTVTDTAQNTYTQAASQNQTSDGHQIRIFYTVSRLNAANSVMATFSGINNHPWLAIFEYSGVTSLDQSAHAQGNGTTPSSGLTLATAANNELVFAALGLPSSSSVQVSPGAGFTLLQQDAPPNTSRAGTEASAVIVTGQYAGTFSLSAAANWSAVVATFR
jgi:hypothetical protein